MDITPLIYWQYWHHTPHYQLTFFTPIDSLAFFVALTRLLTHSPLYPLYKPLLPHCLFCFFLLAFFSFHLSFLGVILPAALGISHVAAAFLRLYSLLFPLQ
ncbi:hypothetical protein BDF19DRAFT_262671 [Syncephalis fuscata]|nr:hypothetical protein BDF19DRAFT_262671 [Syncephalis fuscata]